MAPSKENRSKRAHSRHGSRGPRVPSDRGSVGQVPGYPSDLLVVPKFLEAELGAGHPWIYRNHIPAGFRVPTGTWVRVRCGDVTGWGLWDDESQLALRLYSTRGPLDQAQMTDRVQNAWELRRSMLSRDTSAYRLINGEGDGLPALVVDVYGKFAVVGTYGAAVQRLVPELVTALRRVLEPKGILVRPMTGSAPSQWVYGEPAPDDFVVEEHGVRFFADLAQGHKTGLYLDQRENRVTLANYSSAAKVLNLYSYTGGFSVFAALAGAGRVTSVDIAEPVLRRAQDNFRLNRIDPTRHEFVVADCYEYLKQRVASQERFDLVVCDPPSMAHNRAQLDDAMRAYTRLNALGLRVVRNGGYYAASSCTAQLSPEAFREVLVNAARRAGCTAQIVHESGHAWDHPVKLAHPEGRYLKFVMLRVADGS